MSKAKGSRAERKAIKLLEAGGYTCCTKARGGLGVFHMNNGTAGTCSARSLTTE